MKQMTKQETIELKNNIYVELRDLHIGNSIMFEDMSIAKRIGIEEYELDITGKGKQTVSNITDAVSPIVVSIQENGDLWCW